MADETIYKRNEKGKKLSKGSGPQGPRLHFKNKDMDLNRTIRIGRDKGNDLCLNEDPLVSRKHAVIEKEGKDFYIQDKDSKNGTYLNNNPIPKGERKKLKNGDVVLIGKTRITIAL